MQISGKFERDDNFTTVYSGNTIYTIARKTGEWAKLDVGQVANIGGVLTQEQYDTMRANCSEEGTFTIED